MTDLPMTAADLSSFRPGPAAPAALFDRIVHRWRALRRLAAMRRYRRQQLLWRHLADRDERVQRDLGIDPRRMRRYDWMADMMRH